MDLQLEQYLDRSHPARQVRRQDTGSVGREQLGMGIVLNGIRAVGVSALSLRARRRFTVIDFHQRPGANDGRLCLECDGPAAGQSACVERFCATRAALVFRV